MGMMVEKFDITVTCNMLVMLVIHS